MNATADITRPVVIRDFSEVTSKDGDVAGGKGANLGELVHAGFPVPPGFVVTAAAYTAVRDEAGIGDRIAMALDQLDYQDDETLDDATAKIRDAIVTAEVPRWLTDAIDHAYRALGDDGDPVPVAVRSSATAEDTASASFAGMNESFLNVTGSEAVIDAVRRCWASLFGSRTVTYRAGRGFDEATMSIAVVVQRQIPSTRAGVMFTVDPASGNRDRIVIEAARGLGESVVSGSVSPDRYVVDKSTMQIVTSEPHRQELMVVPREGGGTTLRAPDPAENGRPVLDHDEVTRLARLAVRIEQHYGAPQDTEWAFDPEGTLWMLQSRPVTTTIAAESPRDRPGAPHPGAVLVRGLGAAPGQASGSVRIVESRRDANDVGAGDVVVTRMTTPDWVPVMRRAAAIVTDAGGMTCHAAIVSRELGIPCVVGTGNATERLTEWETVTVDATHGTVTAGAGTATPSRATTTAPSTAPAPPSRTVTATRLLVNLSEPSQVARAAEADVDGVGLLRAEMMLLDALEGVHPLALLEQGRAEEVVSRLADALTTFAVGFGPRPITYRTIDFRTNEFRGLEGGERFEPQEANPMIGFRGALRYVRDPKLLRLELDAIGRVWDAGHRNLHVMLPFVRTPAELRACRDVIDDAGLLRRPGFELWVMAEVPSVLFHLSRYAELGIAGISIGTNDLTQLLLGADRDSEAMASTFDERDEAVVTYVRKLIARARELGLGTSICGQAPSVHPEYADLLVRAGIDAVSVNLDAVDRTRSLLAAAEQRVLLDGARSLRA